MKIVIVEELIIESDVDGFTVTQLKLSCFSVESRYHYNMSCHRTLHDKTKQLVRAVREAAESAERAPALAAWAHRCV